MTEKDHLDTEVSVSASLTETGLHAKAKSRTLAALDRLGGNVLELLNAPIEKRIGRSRAIADGEKKLIELAVEGVSHRMNADPLFAQRVLEQHFGRAFEGQRRKDAILLEAIEDLKADPPNSSDAESGPPELDDQFMARFERYADEATTEELQQRWGRVLAREIRKPGTFSAKALRTVDEMETATAQLFEEVCEARLGDVIPKCLVGLLPFSQIKDLTTAGLFVEPGLTGQVRYFVDNGRVWAGGFGDYAISLPKPLNVPGSSSEAPPLIDQNGTPSVPVYVLTDVGRAISTMLANKERDAVRRLAEQIRLALPGISVQQLQKNPYSPQNFIPF